MRRYNTHVVLDAEGHMVAAYRKIHLFDVDVPNGPVLMESRTTAPGTEVCTSDTCVVGMHTSWLYGRISCLCGRISQVCECACSPSALVVAAVAAQLKPAFFASVSRLHAGCLAETGFVHLFDHPCLVHACMQAVLVDTPAGRVALTVCYDLRFPELYQRLTWDGGAQVI